MEFILQTTKSDEFDVMIFPLEVSVSVNFSNKSIPGYHKVKMTSTRISAIEDTVNEDGYVKLFKEKCFSLFDKAISGMRKGRRIKSIHFNLCIS